MYRRSVGLAKMSADPPIISLGGREEVVLDNENCRSSSGKGSHGFHLVRSKWDPYPWISSVESASSADASGLRPGDCLLDVDGRDVLGLAMKDIGRLIGKNGRASLRVWRRPSDNNAADSRDDRHGSLLDGPLTEVARKLVRAVGGVVRALECPVCLESAAPPVSQCVHGHLLCRGCRPRTARCPVCRVRLGRGRCLLADKAHRALAEALLDDPPVQVQDEHGGGGGVVSRSLHDSIFGRQPRKRESPKAKRLFAKILASAGGGSRADERNASTESLPASSGATTSMDGNLLYGRRWLLRLYDRRKSASTGELDKADETYAEPREAGDSGSMLLGVPQTPAWGGSTESVTSPRLRCPRKSCGECLGADALMEHLAQQHNGPMVHFYRRKVELPFPFPFDAAGAVYVLHDRDEVFLLQQDEDEVWMSSAEANCGINWEWILEADGAELHSRKEVASLREPYELGPHNVAILPKGFAAKTVKITLIELDADEGCVKI